MLFGLCLTQTIGCRSLLTYINAYLNRQSLILRPCPHFPWHFSDYYFKNVYTCSITSLQWMEQKTCFKAKKDLKVPEFSVSRRREIRPQYVRARLSNSEPESRRHDLEAEAYKEIKLNCAIKIMSSCNQKSLVMFIDQYLEEICKFICRKYQCLSL